MVKKNFNLLNSWFIFIKERFPLLSHLPMILLFVLAHAFTLTLANYEFQITSLLLVFVIIFLFFFKMRLYDEIKDYETDLAINKERPLPRGLLKVNDLKIMIAIIITIEILLAPFMGLFSIVSLTFAIFYSLLMYNEFFIGKYIRPHLTTYALLHTVVTVPMGLFIFSALTNTSFLHLNTPLYLFTIISFCLFNIFEFGRKTFLRREERENVESYSKIFGKIGAVLLVLLMASFSFYFSLRLLGFVSIPLLILNGALIFFGALFSFVNNQMMGKCYRNFSSFFIILFYLIYIFEIFTRKGFIHAY